MCLLIYKMINLHFSNRYETSNSLATRQYSPQVWVILKRKLFHPHMLACTCIVVDTTHINGARCLNTFVKKIFITRIVRSQREPRRTTHIRQEEIITFINLRTIIIIYLKFHTKQYFPPESTPFLFRKKNTRQL